MTGTRKTLLVEDELFLSVFSESQARPRPELEAIFHCGEQGYRGADADLSIPLGRGKSLWIFGDTLVGQRESLPLEMPRNSIGILRTNRDGERAFKFFWKTDKGKAKAFFADPRPGQWLWPGTMCLVEGKLYLFLRRFQTCNAIRSEAFRFRFVGLYELRVENPQDDPFDWEIQPLGAPKLARSILWHSGCIAAPDGFLYLWGGRRGIRGNGTMMARCPLEDLKRPESIRWEYYTHDLKGAGWSFQPRSLRPIFPGWASEMSLFYLKKKKVYVTIYGHHRENSIGVQLARSMEGPWTPFIPSFVLPTPIGARTIFVTPPRDTRNSAPRETNCRLPTSRIPIRSVTFFTTNESTIQGSFLCQ
jgi:hypothetical protein